MAIEGPHSRFPILGNSHRQGCIALSTSDAETNSAVRGHKTFLLPQLDLWEVLLPSGFRAVFHEDNQAMMAMVNSGKNPSMRYLSRSHGIAVGWVHERLGIRSPHRDPVEFNYTTSDRMAADIYTKHFTDFLKWNHAATLINIFDPADLVKIASTYYQVCEEPDLSLVQKSSPAPAVA
jgi:hypothetical protein